MQQIGLENKSFFVKIGCSTEERLSPQEILITIIINLKNYQKGCFTDKLEDVFSHKEINDIILEKCDLKNEYNLIEFLAMEIKKSIKNRLNITDSNDINIKIYKKSYQSFCVV